MTSTVKKLYVDTRHRTDDSNSSSDFKITMKDTINCPENCKFALCDISIPHSWRPINNLCNLFYLWFSSNDPSYNGTNFVVKVRLQEKVHEDGVELANEIKDHLKGAILVRYTEAQVKVDNADFDKDTGLIHFKLHSTLTGFKWKVMTTKDLEYYEKNYDPNMKFLINNVAYNCQTHVASNFTTYSMQGTGSLNIVAPYHDINSQILNNLGNEKVDINDKHSSGYSYYTNAININPFRNIYIHSSTLGGYHTLSTNNSRSIIKKVPINENTGFVIFDRVLHSTDYLECGGQSLSTIDFRFCNSNGQVIDLKGDNSTFSIIFDF